MSPVQSSETNARIPELEDLTVQLERARAIEAEFRAFADSVRDYAFITLGLDRNVIGWNRGAELLLGYSSEEMLGQPGALLFTAEDIARDEPEKEMSTALRDGRAEDERWHVRKDGSRFWGSGVVTPLRNASGELRGYVKVMRDRTEAREFEEAVRIREERLRLLLREHSRLRCLRFGLQPRNSKLEHGSRADIRLHCRRSPRRRLLRAF